MPAKLSSKSSIKHAKPANRSLCWYAITAALVLLYLPGAHADSICGKIQLTIGTDAAAEVLASIDEQILETGFDCSIDVVIHTTNTETADRLTSLIDSTEPAFTSALALPSVPPGNPIGALAQAESLHAINDNAVSNFTQGWWISPDALQKHPELKTVLDVLEHPELFVESENSSEGLFFGCPANTGCTHINKNLFRAFEMEKKGWKLVIPESWTELENAISEAVINGQNWFGYYWSPSAIAGKHDIVNLDFGIEYAGNKNWHGCIAVPNCKDPRPTAWNHSTVHTIVTDKLLQAVPKAFPTEALDYLSRRVLPGDVMSKLLAEQADKQLSDNDTARVFIAKHTAIWKPWVSNDTANKVADSLTTLY